MTPASASKSEPERLHALDGSHPTMREEIDRKVVLELERVVLCHRQGKMGNAEVDAALTTLFNAVSGLCDSSMMDLISQTRVSLIGMDQVHQQYRIVLVNDAGDIAGVSFRVGSDQIKILKKRLDQPGIVHVRSFAESTIPSEEALKAYKTVVAAFVKAGYRDFGF